MPYAAELGHRRPVRWCHAELTDRPTRDRPPRARHRRAPAPGRARRGGLPRRQLDAIEALVESRRRVLVVQRTGWGKSAVYFVATALRRAEGAGPTVIVSPLLALMRDQIAAAERADPPSRSTRRTPTSGCGLGSAGAGRGGRAPREPGTPEQPALSRRAAPGPRVVVRPARRRRGTASATGGTTSVPTTGGSGTCSPRCPTRHRPRDDGDGECPRRDRRRRAAVGGRVGGDGTGGREVLTLRGPLARSSLRLGVLPSPLPSSGSPGSSRTSATYPAPASSTRSPWPPPRTSPLPCATPATTLRPTRAGPSRPSGSGSRRRCGTTRSRRSWRRPPSGWVSTSRTSASSCTSGPRRPRRLLPAGRPGGSRDRAR